jgi:hypothetical protein
LVNRFYYLSEFRYSQCYSKSKIRVAAVQNSTLYVCLYDVRGPENHFSQTVAPIISTFRIRNDTTRVPPTMTSVGGMVWLKRETTDWLKWSIRFSQLVSPIYYLRFVSALAEEITSLQPNRSPNCIATFRIRNDTTRVPPTVTWVGGLVWLKRETTDWRKWWTRFSQLVSPIVYLRFVSGFLAEEITSLHSQTVAPIDNIILPPTATSVGGLVWLTRRFGWSDHITSAEPYPQI